MASGLFKNTNFYVGFASFLCLTAGIWLQSYENSIRECLAFGQPHEDGSDLHEKDIELH